MVINFFIFLLILGTAVWWCVDFYKNEINGFLDNMKDSTNRGGVIIRFIMRLVIGILIFQYLYFVFEVSILPLIH